MAGDDAGERTESASEKKRSDAREKGQVARSQDLLSVLVLAAGLTYFVVFGPAIYRTLSKVMTQSFQLHTLPEMSINFGMQLGRSAVWDMALLLAPLVGAVVLVGVGGNLAQVGFLISTKPLEPKLDKLNFFGNFISTFFNKKAVGLLVASIAKLMLIGLVVYLTLRSDAPQIMLLSTLPLTGGLAFVIERATAVLLNVCAAMMVVAIADFYWQRWVHEQDLKMTKQEVKEEGKEMGGNPHVKQQMRKRAQDLATGRMMEAVPTAAVVVNNPTHLSVALRYDHENDGAPVVVAMGADLVALRIRRIAAESDVPMVENVPLARALYGQVKVGQVIPPDLYRAVAEVLAFVMKLKQGNHAPP